LQTLAHIGGDAAVHKAIDWMNASAVLGGCLAFGLFFVVAACIFINIKDY
jgi:hypothetical protein